MSVTGFSHRAWVRSSSAPLLLALVAVASGCGAESNAGDDESELGSAAQALCTVTQLTGVASSASSQETAQFGAELAFDGNAATRWSSAFADPQWIRLDLGGLRYIDSVKLVWEAASAADYVIEISSDGNNWTTVANKTNAAAGARTDTLSNLSAHVGRYVRMTGTRRTTQWGYSLFDFAVFGSTDPNCASVGSGRSISSNLEAEANDGQNGVQFENTTDTGGGQNAGWIDPGDFIEWSIQVPTTGAYDLSARSATTSAASLQVLVDGVAASSLSLPNTGGWQNWSSVKTGGFNLSAGTHKLRVAFTSAGQNLNYVKVSPATASVVELRVPQVDDLVYVSVNGIRHRVGYIGTASADAQWKDVSSWFASGTNNVRVWATSWVNPAGFSLELRVNGTIVQSRSCLPPGCPTREAGVYYKDDFQISGLNLPPLKDVSLTSTQPAKVYLDDEFTGLTTPATLKLPGGSYRLGFGVSNDTPGQLMGRFYERNVQVAQAAQSVNVDTNAPALPVQNVAKIALLPVKYATGTDQSRLAILSQADVDRFASQIQATRNQWLKPYSYGLTDWNVSVLPMETDIVEHNGEVLSAPKYQSLFSQYHFVILFGPSYDVNGVPLDGLVGGAWSGGQEVRFNAEWSVPFPPDYASEGLLHEVLHQYDSDQRDWMHHYTGVGELHGATEHGAQRGEEEGRDWIRWYRTFMRGQAAELSTMVASEARPAPVPVTEAEWFAGTFRTVRWGD